eukprot:Skav223486  [mRNA]  locus=scaffold643:71007:71261:+ [translate_table: standard]
MEVPGATELLQLLQSEIAIRSIPAPPQRTPRKIRYILERMSLANLVSLACSTLQGRFPRILSQELNELRATTKILDDFRLLSSK